MAARRSHLAKGKYFKDNLIKKPIQYPKNLGLIFLFHFLLRGKTFLYRSRTRIKRLPSHFWTLIWQKLKKPIYLCENIYRVCLSVTRDLIPPDSNKPPSQFWTPPLPLFQIQTLCQIKIFDSLSSSYTIVNSDTKQIPSHLKSFHFPS